MLRELAKELECVTTSPEVWEAAVELARVCRRKGVTLPATDTTQGFRTSTWSVRHHGCLFGSGRGRDDCHRRNSSDGPATGPVLVSVS